METPQEFKLDLTVFDLIDQEIKELEKLKEFKDKMPEKEYNKLFKKEFKAIHKKYKQLIKQQFRNSRG